ncbi:MAG: RNA polymerase factor sigma-54 [Snodgrassella sp.]|nr:RNA polymerase factor sigma-54 [Snodgrassella sp.]
MQKPVSQLKLKLNQQLNQKLQQSLRVLQLSTLELQELVSDWLADNPFLEEIDSFNNEESTLAQYVQPPQIGRNHDDIEAWETLPDNPDMYAQLHQQVCHFNLDESTATLVHFLIDNLNEQGYLGCSLIDLVENTPLEWQLDEVELEHALSILQQFEPNGVGARDLKESLSLQLDNLTDKDANSEVLACARLLIAKYLGQWLSTHQLNQLYRQLPQFSPATIDSACNLICRLNPFPCYGLPDGNTAMAIQPDMEIYADQSGNWQLRLLKNALPQIRIENTFEQWIRQQDNEIDPLCKTKLQEAQTYINSLEMRKHTLQRLGEWILQQQHDFFTFGALALIPLTIKATAQELGLAESTISRAINQKYLTCPQGIFPLRYFFSLAVASSDNNATGNSQTAVKSLLQSLISQEDPQRPYSDSHLVKQLAKQGINLARRTVAKYREALKIAPAHQRKLQNQNR